MATLALSTPFTLTNAYTGPSKLLAISPTDSRTPQLFSHSNLTAEIPSNAQWFLTASDTPPFYHLHTSLTGPSRALDVLNDNGTSSVRLILADTNTSKGQYWRFDIWADAAAGPTTSGDSDGGYIYRLTNNYTGEDMHLDVYSDTLGVHLADGEATGQYWSIAKMGSSTTSTTPTDTPRVEFSTAAVAGIAIASVAGLALLIGIVAFLFMKRARRRRAQDAERLFPEAKMDAQRESMSERPPLGYERVVAARQAAPVELAAVPLETVELEGVSAVGELDGGGRRFSWI